MVGGETGGLLSIRHKTKGAVAETGVYLLAASKPVLPFPFSSFFFYTNLQYVFSPDQRTGLTLSPHFFLTLLGAFLLLRVVGMAWVGVCGLQAGGERFRWMAGVMAVDLDVPLLR